MPKNYFGEEIAKSYDDPSAEMFQPAKIDPVVNFLAELATDGTALELGIGTGRIALPLAQRGIRVQGIDLSEAMVARLRAKPGGDHIPVTIGDFATAAVEGRFSVGYLVFNDHIATAEEQLVDAIERLQGVDDLILDMRYNGGGYLDIASELTYMISGRTGTFETPVFNSKNPNRNPVTGQQPLQPTPIHTTNGPSSRTGCCGKLLTTSSVTRTPASRAPAPR